MLVKYWNKEYFFAKRMAMLKIYLPTIFFVVAPILARAQKIIKAGRTKITMWQDDKTTAISLTYDDNTINQFRVAIPIMKDGAAPPAIRQRICAVAARPIENYSIGTSEIVDKYLIIRLIKPIKL